MLEPCSHRFTAAEGGARLAATAAAGNTIVTECGAFIATRLLHEEAYNIRGLLSAGRQRSIHVGRAANVKPDAYELTVLTDLKVVQATNFQDVDDWAEMLETKEVLVCTSQVLRQILERRLLLMCQINVLVIDSCHLIYKDEDLQYIMQVYKKTEDDKRPRILAITHPLFNSIKPVDDEPNDRNAVGLIQNSTDDLDNDEIKATEEPSGKSPNIDKCDVIKELGVQTDFDDYAMYSMLESKIHKLEDALCCRMDLAEDIDGCKRISGPTSKPKEVLIEYESKQPVDEIPREYTALDHYMRETVHDVMEFLEDHRHDPTEIYGDELYDEFKSIPDPSLEPRRVFYEFLYILDQLGPYAADKAAFSLLMKLEKLKIKVPYERHFLLLRLCTTTLVKIRCFAEEIFNTYDSDWEKIKKFSTPKLLRFVEILEKFTPPDVKASIENNTFKFKRRSDEDETDELKKDEIKNDVQPNNNIVKMLSDIDSCDFNILGNRIEDKINVIQGNLKDLDVNDSSAEKNSRVKNQMQIGRRGGRGRPRRPPARGQAASPDALCALVYMHEPVMAKTLFMVLVDITRCLPSVSYINSQYCCVEVNTPSNCQKQRRSHEEVLKKFRMHECNLLLTTSALEEGIDLPRCNLVLRWDEPPSYRSYALCRGRSRAARGGAAVLGAAPRTDSLLQRLATYKELDQIITRKCGCGIQDEPPPDEETHADSFNAVVKPYSPSDCLPPCRCRSDKIKQDMANSMRRTISDSENDFIEEKNEKNDGENREDDKSDREKNDSEKDGGLGSDDKIDKSPSEKNDSENSEEYLRCVADKSEKDDGDECFSEKNDSDTYSDNNTNSDNNTKNNRVNTDSFKCVCQNESTFSNASVDLNSAIALINRYCAKLPSDTFTRLAPQWWVEQVRFPDSDRASYVCTLRLPLNCPVKYNIVGHPMTTRVLARRMVALQACRILHKSGELDNQLMPIGKENFKAVELENAHSIPDSLLSDNDAARPGTTKRRQYYYKRTASAFTDCQPVIDTSDSELEKPADIESEPSAPGESAYKDTLGKIESTDTPGKIESKDRPGKIESKDSPDKIEPKDPPGEIESKDTPGKSESKDTPGKSESKDTTGKIESDQSSTQSAGAGNIKDTTEPVSSIQNTGILTEPGRSIEQKESDRNHGKMDCNSEISGKIESELKTENEKTKPQKKTDNKSSNTESAGGKRNMLYAIESSLWCALPERYNTRGRRLHAPQHAHQALAILMARDEPTNLAIPAFPVYTRSGEVLVSVKHVPDADVRMTPRRGRLVRRFMRFVFTEVLRVRRRGMTLQSEGTTRNNYYIVPTLKSLKDYGCIKIDVDWTFLEQIYKHTEQQRLPPDKPLQWHIDDVQASQQDAASEPESGIPLKNPNLKEGEVFVFSPEQYKEAVVTPWYRNQDQPQFFLVAEICWNLTPDSSFPSEVHDTFRSYYSAKYSVQLTQPEQPLLDVDHTSARLNLLTPRYVNRKGVALPVSSERTRRAKRDRLDQKQILVPELCTVHPFAAPLWFATVALPCVLYRINALLIADEIRRAVAVDVSLGTPRVDVIQHFSWPPLHFGWCLSQVLSADEKVIAKKEDDSDNDASPMDEEISTIETVKEVENESESNEEKIEKTINEIMQAEQEKINQEDAESGFEIGTWSNDMASSIVDEEFDEFLEPLPPNLTFCTSADGGVNWCDPVQKPKEYNPPRGYTVADSDCSYTSSEFDSDDSDFEIDGADTDGESGFGSNRGTNASMGVRIEYKTAHEAEAVDLDTKKTQQSPQRDPRQEALAAAELRELLLAPEPVDQYTQKFQTSVDKHRRDIENGLFVKHGQPVCDLLPDIKPQTPINPDTKHQTIFPKHDLIELVDGQITIESIEKNKRVLLQQIKNSMPDNEVSKLNCFFMRDINIDAPGFVNEKIVNVGFDCKTKYEEKVLEFGKKEFVPYYEEEGTKEFDFDYQPNLEGHPGPSPSLILQALTMSNANDGINLERLETIGDSFLKFAITAYLYCAHPTVHEGKLSHMRSKQVSNLNLYRLGRSARLGSRMIASKFEPHDNWLPPCHVAPQSPQHMYDFMLAQGIENKEPYETTGCYIPYNLITQHSIPDKSIADCVEALIGAYLLSCGPRGALLFMAWLGISVLPQHRLSLPRKDYNTAPQSECGPPPLAGARRPYCDEQGNWYQIVYGSLVAPPSPLLLYVRDPHGELQRMLSGYDALEETLQYRFNDRSLLLQALTHASHQRNTLTDCYQRLEFLGDAILDYLITRHLYEDSRRHSPGALTDLRSALVNNTIFATLAVRHGFHKYFRHMSPGLSEVLLKYVRIQEENGHSISEEHYLIQEDELEQAEDVEVPKALGDLFESIAGAIFLDSGMSLGSVWRSYERLMGAELEAFSAAAPKSPVRELLEAEPDTAKFGKPERLADGRRVRVCVEVFGRGVFKGVGRNYRIAKGTAARCALRHLRKHRR